MAALRVVVAIALFAFLCHAQIFTANLTGVVTDTDGAAIPGVNVVVRNMATSEERRTVTGAEGRYTFSQILPGNVGSQCHRSRIQDFRAAKRSARREPISRSRFCPADRRGIAAH